MKLYLLAALFLFPFVGSSQVQNSTDTASGLFTKVDIEASVDKKTWQKHLQKVLVPVIERAAGKKGVKVGQYTVEVRFLVEIDGSISDVEAINDPGYGLAEGAVKAVKTGPHWTPGQMLNGQKVRSYHTQPITFVISTK